ncbi:hypothetical protein [Streptomyces sp. BE133]|uniref:hypothetical protein n=1 Tax=Streptomyces sp. BE133 TaxID=3002523 RepID=UPI002E75D84F|nr:hypothetical protein [Streptomyces sp. BE133]MEE1811821.1 hypothetical protein [Streptomyces sp. BE133]
MPHLQAVAGRACRTSNGQPADHHRARRDAAGTPPYEQWKQQGLWAGPQPFTTPAAVKEAEKARADTRGTAQRLRTVHDPTGTLDTHLPLDRGYARFPAAQAPDASTGDHDQDDAAGAR